MSAEPLPLHAETASGFRFEDLPDTWWPRHEILDGSLHVTPAPAPDHQLIAHRLACALEDAVPQEHQVLAGTNVLRRGETDRLLIPDLLVVDGAAMSRARKKQVSYLEPADVFLAVEIISPSSRTTDLIVKRGLYRQWRTPIYWVLDPKSCEVHEFGLIDSSRTWLANVDLDRIWPEKD